MSQRRQMNFKLETWTPAMAERALKKNRVNRSIRHNDVEKYAKDMQAEAWDFNGDTIRFDWFGNVLDGQHRLLALIKSGKSVDFLVVRNLAPEVQDTINIGRSRTMADILHFRGEGHAQLLGATMRMIAQVLKDNMTTTRANTSTTEMLNLLDEHSEIRTSTEIGWWSKTAAITRYPPSVIATAHWMIARINGQEEANDFMTRIVTQANEAEGSAVLALTRRMNDLRRRGTRVHQKNMLGMIIKAWNYEVKNEKVYRIYHASKAGPNSGLPIVAKKNTKKDAKKAS